MFPPCEKLSPWKTIPPWNLCHSVQCPICFFRREKLTPWKFTVVTSCVLLTRDLFAIAKFLVSILFSCSVRIFFSWCRFVVHHMLSIRWITKTFIGQTTEQQTRTLYTDDIINPVERRGNYSATANDMKLVHCPLTVSCYIWYSEEGTGRGRSPPRHFLVVPNVTTHPTTDSVV